MLSVLPTYNIVNSQVLTWICHLNTFQIFNKKKRKINNLKIIFLFCFVLFLRQGLAPDWSTVVPTWLPAASTSGAQAFSHLSPQVVGSPGPCHYSQLIFFFGRDWVSLCCSGCFWTPELKWSSCLSLPKCWDYRCRSLCPASSTSFYTLVDHYKKVMV